MLSPMSQITFNGRRVPGFGLGDGSPAGEPMSKGVGFLFGAGTSALGSILVSELSGGKIKWPLVLAATLGGGAVGAIVAPGSVQAATPAVPSLPTVVPSVTPQNPTSMTLQAGHRYSVAQLAPVPGAPVATTDQAQAMFDAIMPGALHVVSITPASVAQPTTFVMDVIKTVPFTVPSTMPVTDMGPSPATS
jgi:hypothetical protein